MVLTRTLRAMRVNWRPKPENLTELARRRCRSASTFVFFDDDSPSVR
jgi:predicted enzyme involved in methoxymalonyl-ACP biosynthesis